MKTKISLFNILIFLFCSLTMHGCKPGTSSIPPDLGQTTRPKSGSTFTFRNVPLDKNGTAEPDSAYTTMDSVMESGINFSGKNNVVLFASRIHNGSWSESYLNYEANGDFSIYFPNASSLPPWVTLPVHSRNAQVIILIDTLIGAEH